MTCLPLMSRESDAPNGELNTTWRACRPGSIRDEAVCCTLFPLTAFPNRPIAAPSAPPEPRAVASDSVRRREVEGRMSVLTWTVSESGGHYADLGRGRIASRGRMVRCRGLWRAGTAPAVHLLRVRTSPAHHARSR